MASGTFKQVEGGFGMSKMVIRAFTANIFQFYIVSPSCSLLFLFTIIFFLVIYSMVILEPILTPGSQECAAKLVEPAIKQTYFEKNFEKQHSLAILEKNILWEKLCNKVQLLKHHSHSLKLVVPWPFFLLPSAAAPRRMSFLTLWRSGRVSYLGTLSCWRETYTKSKLQKPNQWKSVPTWEETSPKKNNNDSNDHGLLLPSARFYKGLVVGFNGDLNFLVLYASNKIVSNLAYFGCLRITGVVFFLRSVGGTYVIFFVMRDVS